MKIIYITLKKTAPEGGGPGTKYFTHISKSNRWGVNLLLESEGVGLSAIISVSSVEI